MIVMIFVHLHTILNQPSRVLSVLYPISMLSTMSNQRLSVQKVFAYLIPTHPMVNPLSFIFHSLIFSSSSEISIIKETLTTTTTLTTEYKKDKNDLGHIMISYNHSTRVLCSKIAKALKVKKSIL